MKEKEVREVLSEITVEPDAETEYALRHADCVIDIPQSGERFDRQGMRQMQRSFPGGPPAMRLERLAGSGDVWVAELVSDYGDRYENSSGIFNVCLILEFADGRIIRETRYYAQPFDPPEERRRWQMK